MIKTILFDFAGVIGSEGYWSLVREKAANLEKDGERFTQFADLADKGGISHDDFLTQLSKMLGISKDSIWDEIFSRVVINQELVTFIGQLKKHYKIGLFSNYKHEFLEEILKRHTLYELFDFVYISSRHKMIKPEAGAFRKALEMARAVPEETLFIDDRIGHIEAAQKLGIRGIVYTSVGQLENDLKNIGIT